MEKDLVLGIDLSTTGCKAAVWDLQGRLQALGRSPLTVEQPRPLWYEQSATSWQQAAWQAMRAALAGLDARRLAALSIAHQRETFVPVDERGRPLRPAILWLDERAGDMLPELETLFDRRKFHQVTGKPLSGNLSVVKLAWLRRYEPQVFRQAHYFLDVHAYLVACLTGEFRTGWGCADPTGLFDLRTCDWSPEILSALELTPERFPPAFPPGAVIGAVTAAAAQETGLPAGLPVVSGLGDGQACGLGAGLSGPGESYLSLGTSVVSGTFSPSYLTSPHFRTTVAGLPGAFFLETVILGGAYTLDWFLHQFNAQPEAGQLRQELEAQAAALPPGAQGLLLVPYWNSAMNPYWDASASGITVGWRGAHGRAHFYRAILEGIAFEQRLHTAGVEQALGHPLSRYIVSGGGANSSLWLQILADVTGREVRLAAAQEAAALGAAILAAAGTSYSSVLQAAAAMAPPSLDGCLPDAGRNAFYTRLFEEVYRPLYPALQPLLQRLEALVHAGQ